LFSRGGKLLLISYFRVMLTAAGRTAKSMHAGDAFRLSNNKGTSSVAGYSVSSGGGGGGDNGFRHNAITWRL
jgi:hypothetical protein